MNKNFSLYSQPYLDTFNQCYQSIITLNTIPKGPLAKFIRKVNLAKLSPFKQATTCTSIPKCTLGILSFNNNCNQRGCNLMTVEDFPYLVSFLMENGYTIDTKITKMIQNSSIQIADDKTLICFVTYNK